MSESDRPGSETSWAKYSGIKYKNEDTSWPVMLKTLHPHDVKGLK